MSAGMIAGRCWDCHIAHLRSLGQGARADRLIVRKRQLDEGRFDFDRLAASMAELFAEEFTLQADPDPDRCQRPRQARPLRHGRPEG